MNATRVDKVFCSTPDIVVNLVKCGMIIRKRVWIMDSNIVRKLMLTEIVWNVSCGINIWFRSSFIHQENMSMECMLFGIRALAEVVSLRVIII